MRDSGQITLHRTARSVGMAIKDQGICFVVFFICLSQAQPRDVHLSASETSEVCFGQLASYVCQIPDVTERVNGSFKYLTSVPSWEIQKGNETLLPDAVHFKVTHINVTSYEMKFNVTESLFNGSDLSLSCFLILNDSKLTRDESEVIINPPEQPHTPESLELVMTSHDSASVKWRHNPQCFNSCGIYFNLTLYKIHNGSLNVTSLASVMGYEYNFTDLMSETEYKVVVFAACSQSSAPTSKTSEMIFTTTAASDDTLPSNMFTTTDVPIAVIAGGGVCIFIIVVLIGLLGVVLPCVACVRRSKRRDYDMKDDTPKVANTYSVDGFLSDCYCNSYNHGLDICDTHQHPSILCSFSSPYMYQVTGGEVPATVYANVERVLPEVPVEKNPAYIPLSDLTFNHVTSYANVSIKRTNI